MKKSAIALAIAASIGTGAAHAVQIVVGQNGAGNYTSDSANFTMQQPTGAIQGGSNDVDLLWTGTAHTSINDYTGMGLPGSQADMTISSTTLFSSNLWTAHDLQIFTPGTYVFDATMNANDAGAVGSAGNPLKDTETGTLTLTVPANMLGAHMLFDWNGSHNIDVAAVFNPAGGVYGSGLGATTDGLGSCGLFGGGAGSNCLWDGGGFGSQAQPAGDKVWQLVTVDSDADGTPGQAMPAGGPFQFFQAGFNADILGFTPAPVPVPAAVWLMGSGLIGLVGVGRRRRKQA